MYVLGDGRHVRFEDGVWYSKGFEPIDEPTSVVDHIRLAFPKDNALATYYASLRCVEAYLARAEDPTPPPLSEWDLKDLATPRLQEFILSLRKDHVWLPKGENTPAQPKETPPLTFSQDADGPMLYQRLG